MKRLYRYFYPSRKEDDMNRIFQYLYLTVTRVASDTDMNKVRFDALVTADRERSYDIVLEITNASYPLTLKEFGIAVMNVPKPVFLKGSNYQVHYSTVAYRERVQEVYGRELFYVSFPPIELVRLTMDSEWELSGSPEETLNPRTSPMINITFGPEYFSIWCLAEYPNIDGEAYMTERDIRLMAMERELVPELLDLAGETTPDTKKIEALYARFGIYLRIYTYLYPLSRYEI